MDIFDEYQHQAHSLFEGFSGIESTIEGWSADHPQSLSVKLTVDPFNFLQELDGSTLGQPEDEVFRLDPLTLLAVAKERWHFEGEFNSGKDAADLYKTGDDSYWEPENFTGRQRQAFDKVCQVLDALYAGLRKDWDAIGKAVYTANLSEGLDLPGSLKLPQGTEGWEVTLRRGSTYHEHIPMSDLNDQHEYFDWWEVAEGHLQAGELKVSIDDEDGVTIAEFDTDGIVLWKDEAELTAIIEKMIEENGGLEQYIPCVKEAA